MKKVTYTSEGIIKINGKIIGAMYDAKKTNIYKVQFKYYWKRFKNNLQSWCNAAANFR